MYGKAWLETSASVTACMIVRAFGPQRPSTNTEPVRSAIETRSPPRSCAPSPAGWAGAAAGAAGEHRREPLPPRGRGEVAADPAARGEHRGVDDGADVA